MKKGRLMVTALSLFLASLMCVALSGGKSVRAQGRRNKQREKTVVTNLRLSLPAADGKILPFKFQGDDLEAAMLSHPAPEVWLVAPARKMRGEDSAESSEKIELSQEAKNIVSSYWKTLLAAGYRLEVARIPDSEARRMEILSIGMARQTFLQELPRTKVSTPDGPRLLLSSEVASVLEFVEVIPKPRNAHKIRAKLVV